MSYVAASRIAQALCHGYPKVCDTHVQETVEIIKLLPDLLMDLSVVTVAARAVRPDLDQMHPADRTIALSDAMSVLGAVSTEITREVLS